MGPENYLKDRVQNQLSWYSQKSANNKRWYQSLRLLQITLGIAVTAGTAYADALPWGAYLPAIFGALISLSAAWETVFDYQNNWVRYRRIKEDLLREKLFFETSSGPYRRRSADDDENEGLFSLFVTRVEGLLSEEVEQWSSSASRPATPRQDPPPASGTA